MLESFSDFWKKPKEHLSVAQAEHRRAAGQHAEPSKKSVDHQKLIKDFHAHHEAMEHAAKQLHEAGYHIHIDYNSPDVVRHGKKSGTHFVNEGLNKQKKIQISKRFPLRPFD